ncbi:peptidyl-dipeptidase Dcp [Kineococcus xinjiangensis]|uniref:Peptidyl-dipeptidase Dcp n=1 Tax=Kineococcus xinjiangensis TaxID=512762 RepID=A0A2S6ITA7_9ACTN|nr:M3 family metallopeptidase [Kineococcus xinjiangensis]PPK97401.1 peptidyl-dipeptidase Dcp [Kineococcus xinjiangensis]
MTAELAADNPFAVPSGLPHGLPPFGALRFEHFAPAFEAGMAEQLAEVEAIATDPREPDVENTLEALQRSGRLLGRVGAVFFALVGADSSPELQELHASIAPRLAAHADAVRLDPRIVARIAALHERRDDLGADAETLFLLRRLRSDAERAGALLPPERQERLRELNAQLSELTAAFSDALLADTNASAVHVDDAAELAGLSAGELSAAREAARARGLDGYLVSLVLPTAQPVLAALRSRRVRERIHRASVARGARGGAHDTRSTLLRIASLRAERAALLGFAGHADHVVADETAGTAEAAQAMLARLAPAAVANARREARELTEVLAAAGEQGPLRAWDWAFCAERLRGRVLSLDAEALRPYFEAEAVLADGVLATASRLYGLGFTERADLPRYHPDVRVFEVRDVDGSSLGLFLLDLFARPSKRGGAWMTSFVEQSSLLGSRPVVLNVLNVPKPAPGEPALLSLDEVTTLFHEFGHALHGLLSDVRYPRFSGTSVPRDFVEFPSQVNEMWAFHPDVLPRYARHHGSGEPLPAETVRALAAAQRFGQGFATTEYLAAALLDQAWHRVAPGELDGMGAEDVEEFEARALEAAGVALEEVPPRYRSTYFNHVFGGGYAAAYYSYLWSEVLDADTVEWFGENGGLSLENGSRFRRLVLARGGSTDPLAAYREFRGRDARIEPLLQRRGLTQE